MPALADAPPAGRGVNLFPTGAPAGPEPRTPRDEALEERFRRVRAALEGALRPSAADISDEGRGAALLRQAAAARPEERPAGAADAVAEHLRDPRERPDRLLLQAQIDAAHEALGRPSAVRAATLRAVVDERGRPLAVDVVASSGSVRFDALVRDELRRALLSAAPGDRRGRTVALLRATATRAVRPPRVTPIASPRGRLGGAVPNLSFGFDETRGDVRPQVPLTEDIRVQVDVLEVVLDRAPPR